MRHKEKQVYYTENKPEFSSQKSHFYTEINPEDEKSYYVASVKTDTNSLKSKSLIKTVNNYELAQKININISVRLYNSEKIITVNALLDTGTKTILLV